MSTTAQTGVLVRTELPGPRSRLLLDEQATNESSARTYPRNVPIALSGGRGSYVEDLDGNRFLDFLSGAGVLALGHSHPELLAAAHRQLDIATHSLDFPTEVKQEFTRRLLDLLPGDMGSRSKLHFCGPTGADGIDAAIKLCKTYTGRADVIAFHGGFHGSTQSTIAITGLRSSKEHLGNLMPGVSFFPYSSCFRCPLSLKPDSCEINCAQYLANVLDDPNGGVRRPAAVILELVQGEGGVVPARLEFVQQLREITRRLDIPLVIDEVQSGCGRTGTWYAFEQYGIEPDVVVSSKAVGGGHPASVIVYNERLDGWKAGAHTGTFRGNQLAFASGAALMRVVAEDGLLDNVREVGAQLRQGLQELQHRFPFLGDVRGMGLMLGVEVVPTADRSASEVADLIRKAALRRGLLFELAGRDDCVVRFLPPLNLDRTEAEEALEIFGAAVAEVAEECARPLPSKFQDADTEGVRS
ncbi:aspartate aminotransferase family protein [Streptomyces sp. NBC_01408]|uniref:aspartate aminotransferase family protein n=1 Tax=Streptomyces sp. NBC_01408 TaxID=2903855 RepID=UPI002259BA52|nr:diaminobutyrate--2-oxoglutarate transaminase family protein [Streptomyces sp. NBC_01408]MCX4692537.1 diaminobutyrate--2-oxoglutarate transaminase family protein [Streptomyces sp. NBC_01408]